MRQRQSWAFARCRRCGPDERGVVDDEPALPVVAVRLPFIGGASDGEVVRRPTVLLATVAACGARVPLSAVAEDERFCSVNDDCVIVDFACGCAGGFAVAANADDEEDVQARAPNVCSPGVVDPGPLDSCSATTAVCVFGLCELSL